jgi:CRISPR-associated protein Csd2
MTTPLSHRYEFVLLYDVENGNPNGDPDAGNMPRIDPETGFGIVTDVCLKRKIRNYVELVKEDSEGYKIYIKEGIPLNSQQKTAYIKAQIPVPQNDNDRKSIRTDIEKIRTLRNFMCQNFYDIRTFGAVMNTDVPAGIVRGPVQINFSRSIDPIMQQELTITRVTVTEEGQDKTTEMGRKHVVPYGLYRVEGYISAKLANDPTKGTGFSEEDLELFWDALINMFEHDHSAARGKMATRKLVVFQHECELGNAPSHRLFELVEVKKNPQANPPRNFSDYSINVDKEKLPLGVTIFEKI